MNTLVKSYNRNLVSITKGNYSVLVGLRKEDVIIVSLNNKKHIPYVFHGGGTKHAYEKFLHLIGKMVLKNEDSKYFSKPIKEEHCINGHPEWLSKEYWESFAEEIISEYHKSK